MKTLNFIKCNTFAVLVNDTRAVNFLNTFTIEPSIAFFGVCFGFFSRKIGGFLWLFKLFVSFEIQFCFTNLVHSPLKFKFIFERSSSLMGLYLLRLSCRICFSQLATTPKSSSTII
eukprot:NODE_270_length_11220_cov_0.981387.p9 type:complete len:116 gc:universal NODE_270_length_11220_cov_0.981387:7371-7718(+)